MEALGADGRPLPGQHSGMWRCSPGKKYYCSLSKDGQQEGPICTHGAGIIQPDHWSCCGLKEAQAKCPKGPGGGGAVAVRVVPAAAAP
eukprot:gene53262-27387_t